MKISLFLISFSFVILSFGQETGVPKWGVSISYGLGIPVGGFRKVAPIKSVYYNSISNLYHLNGFDKDGNSAALNGQFVAFNSTYSLSNGWFFVLEGHFSQNAVNTKPVFNYLNSVLNPDFTAATNKDDKVTAVMVGIGHHFHLNNFNFSIVPVVGIAKIGSPDYSFTWFNAPFNFDVIELKNSPLFGLNSNVMYRMGSKFHIAIKMDFNSANFDYTTYLRSPGVNPFIKEDRVTYRLLKIGLTIGFRF